jgi:DNA-K related protein
VTTPRFVGGGAEGGPRRRPTIQSSSISFDTNDRYFFATSFATFSRICFIEIAVKLACAKQHCAPYLAALGLLLNRAPLHAGPETVVSPDFVEHAYSAFRGLDWADPQLLELQSLFLRAARVVGDRSLDVPMPLRELIASKVENSGVPPLRTAKIRGLVPVGRADRASLYDEPLPPGLVLGLDAAGH